MNIEEVFEQWSDIESEIDESDSSSESEEENIGNESDEQSWREDTGKFLCISIVCFTSANITKKHNHWPSYPDVADRVCSCIVSV